VEVEASGAYRQALETIAWSREHGYGVFHLNDVDMAIVGKLSAKVRGVRAVSAAVLVKPFQRVRSAPRSGVCRASRRARPGWAAASFEAGGPCRLHRCCRRADAPVAAVFRAFSVDEDRRNDG
jgi:hypothetical protein